ncbi:hypothetical protein [Nocardia sp. NPDC005825]|uniref:hypothetical protein n=1 Tax=unclassified Nocardia TaxID=2637762 RepID=UPI0033E54025
MTAIAGSLITTIESIWGQLSARHPDVPDVVVTMAAGSVGRKGLRLGHFGPARWKHGADLLPELFVGGEGLAFGAREVLGTLLHEAAHGAACTRGIADTSRGGAYHNGKFREIAAEFGLVVERSTGSGWSVTVVPDATAAQYGREIAALERVLVAHRRSEHDPVGVNDEGSGDHNDEEDEGEEEKAPRNGRALVCMCVPVRRVRARQKTIDAGPILCGVCREPFTIAESTPPQPNTPSSGIQGAR